MNESFSYIFIRSLHKGIGFLVVFHECQSEEQEFTNDLVQNMLQSLISIINVQGGTVKVTKNHGALLISWNRD